MKFTNTKAQVKEVGTDVKIIAKTSAKLVGDLLKVPVAVGKDISEHREYRCKADEIYAKYCGMSSAK